MRHNNRPNGVFKTENDYQKLIDPAFYEQCPKAVFAALAVSFCSNWANVPLEEITKGLANEWDILNKNGIVPQKPKK